MNRETARPIRSDRSGSGTPHGGSRVTRDTAARAALDSILHNVNVEITRHCPTGHRVSHI
jgi:hypothetical protein